MQLYRDDSPQSYGRFDLGINLLSLTGTTLGFIVSDFSCLLLLNDISDSMSLFLLSLGGNCDVDHPSASAPVVVGPWAEVGPNRCFVTLNCSPKKNEMAANRAVRIKMQRLWLFAASGGEGEGSTILMVKVKEVASSLVQDTYYS